MNIAVIGAGLTGATAARRLADNGNTVTVFEKEFGQYGGACADLEHASGIYISKYGPHIFHTDNEEVYSFISRFTTFRRYHHHVKAMTEKGLVPWPINHETLRIVFGKDDTQAAIDEMNSDIELTNQILNSGDGEANFETAAMRAIGGELYRTLIKGYTETQWRCKASELPAELFGRIRVSMSEINTFFPDKYVCLPRYGYSELVKLMLDHPGITIRWKKVTYEDLFALVYGFDMLISTAPTNDLFESAYQLPFGKTKFHYHSNMYLGPHAVPVMNINKGGKYTRFTDYSAMYTGKYDKGMTGVEEPSDDGVPLYTIRTKQNVAEADRQIATLAKMTVISTGRMGGYKYVNMDQAIELGLNAAKRVIAGVEGANI